jgi:hypothetical protein
MATPAKIAMPMMMRAETDSLRFPVGLENLARLASQVFLLMSVQSPFKDKDCPLIVHFSGDAR